MVLACDFGVEFMDTCGVDTEGHLHGQEMEHSTYEKGHWIRMERDRETEV